MKPNDTDNKSADKYDIIIAEKVTLNSISIQFKNSGIITNVKCYHFEKPKKILNMFGVSGKWKLFDSKCLDVSDVTFGTNCISFHYLESLNEYRIEFIDNNSNIIYCAKYICIDNDISYNLNSNNISIIADCFGVPSTMYISPNIFDLNFDINKNMDWIIESNNDWMWTMYSDIWFIKLLLLNGLFTLPSGSIAKKFINHFGKNKCYNNPQLKYIITTFTKQIWLCPNPILKQVIDFRILNDNNATKTDNKNKNTKNKSDIKNRNTKNKSDNSNKNTKNNNKPHKSDDKNRNNKNKINFLRNKKLKRYKNDFYLSVNYKFRENLKLCKDYHIKQSIIKKQKEKLKKNNDDNDNDDDKEYDSGDGTWITDQYIDILCSIHNKCDNNDVLQFITFELWDATTFNIVAASFGYSIGSILCDYTFMTLVRDNRSCGNILTKVIGDCLQKCEYDIWYWGFKLDYMNDYNKYNGKEINRKEFANIFKNSCKNIGNNNNNNNNYIVNYQNKKVLNIVDFIKNGKAAIKPLPQWINNNK